MTTLGKIQAHQEITRLKKCRINGHISWGARVRLNIDVPFFGIKSVSFESSISAKVLNFINVLISTIISCSWISLTIFVSKTRTIGLKNVFVSKVL